MALTLTNTVQGFVLQAVHCANVTLMDEVHVCNVVALLLQDVACGCKHDVSPAVSSHNPERTLCIVVVAKWITVIFCKPEQ